MTTKSTTLESKDYITVARVGGDYETIQQAVDNAVPGQTIKIHGGTYHEAVVIETDGLVIEAFDPLAEPVIIDGADRSFAETPLEWEEISDNVFRADYVWPLKLPDEETYTTRGGEGSLLSVYENGRLLRGYRDPFDTRYFKGKSLRYFAQDSYGIAGPYSGINQLDDTDRESGGNLDRNSMPRTAPGAFFYDANRGQLFISPQADEAPAECLYEIPVLENLFLVRAANLTLRNLVLTNPVDYAVVCENADRGKIEACVFTNAHAAVLLKSTVDFTISNNLITENGFYEHYGSFDISGTLYEKSTIAFIPGDSGRPAQATTGIVITGNVIRGTPFFLPLLPLKVSVSRNLITYSAFGVFASTSPAQTSPASLEGEYTVSANVFHHLDGGLNFPAAPAGSGSLHCFRNCFYLDGESLPLRAAKAVSSATVFFYHNTLVFAKNNQERILPLTEESGVFSQNNLYIGQSMLYTVYVDDGSADPAPLVSCPQLSSNIYLMPSQPADFYGDFTMEDGMYVYKRRLSAESAPSAPAAIEIFQNEPAFTTAVFFSDEFDPLVTIESDVYIATGVGDFCDNYFDMVQAFFTPGADSPLRDNAPVLPSGYPDIVDVPDNRPDLGALEY